MRLDVCRTLMRGAVFSVYSAKAFVEFYDEATRRLIPKKKWSEEMKAAAANQIASAEKPPFIFKVTKLGWVFLAAIVVLFCFF